MKNNQHVLPNGKQWSVKGEGNTRNTVIVGTKDEAIRIARRISKNQSSELIIHSRNGKIIKRDSHGNDPFPPKG